MSTVRQFHDVDLESADSNDGGTADSGGGIRHSHGSSVSEDSGSDANETVRVAEDNDQHIKDKPDWRKSNDSDCSVEIVDPKAEAPDVKLHLGEIERECRICQLRLDDEANRELGQPIELGCACKDDLAAAHKECAETWFKIKGNKTCEICGSIAQNVTCAVESELLEQWNVEHIAAVMPAPLSHSVNLWHSRWCLNSCLGILVFLFVLSWFFHFNLRL